jgi:plasmid stabilization system protein ParE
MNSPRRINYKVRITPVAEKDLAEIYQYIARDNPTAAAKFFKELRKKAQTLKWSPQRCAKIPEKIDVPYEYRHLIVKRYRIIFCILKDTVWVMRIVHGARQLDLTTLLYFMQSLRR